MPSAHVMSTVPEKKGLSYAQLAKQPPAAPITAPVTTPAQQQQNNQGGKASGGSAGPRQGNQGNRNSGSRGGNSNTNGGAGRGAPRNNGPAPAPKAAAPPTTLNFAAAAAAPAKVVAPQPAAPEKQQPVESSTLSEGPKGSAPSKPTSNSDSAPSQPARSQSQGRSTAWGNAEGLTFKSNVLLPPQSVATKVRFGSQSEIDENAAKLQQQQQNSAPPVSVEANSAAQTSSTSAPTPAAPSTTATAPSAAVPVTATAASTSSAPPATTTVPLNSNYDGVQPLAAPTPVHHQRGGNFHASIPRVLSAPPQLDNKVVDAKLNPNLSKAAAAKAAQSAAQTHSAAPASVPPSEDAAANAPHQQAYPMPNQPHAQYHHQQSHQHHGPPHSGPPSQGQHHAMHQHHPSFPQGQPTHFAGQQMPQQGAPAPFHPSQQQHPQHYQTNRPAHIRPPPSNIPPQGIIPNQYSAKPGGFKGNQYAQTPQGGTNIPPHPAGMAQVPVGAAGPYYAFPGQYPYAYDPNAQFVSYPQPPYYQSPQVPYLNPMIRPSNVPGVAPVQARYPQQPTPTSAPFIPSITPTKAVSKAIKIVNPHTKEALEFVKASPPATPTPVVDAAPVIQRSEIKEKAPVQVTIKDAKGNKIELKSPSKTAEKPIEAVEPVKKELEVSPAPEPVPEPPKVEAAVEVVKEKKAPKVEEPVAPSPVDVKEAVESEAVSAAEVAEPEAGAEPVAQEEESVSETTAVDAKEKPAIIVSAASDVELVEEPAAKKGEDLEDGEIPAAETNVITGKKLAQEPESAKSDDVPAERVEPRLLTIDELQGRDYVTIKEDPKSVTKKRIVYSIDILKTMFEMVMTPPPGLPPLSIFASEETGKPSPRGSRPSSGSGTGHYLAQGSSSASGHATPKRSGTMGLPHVKGIMPTVAAPPSSRSMRNSVGPGQPPAYGMGAGSSRNSQGSWDSKGGQGLPPRPGGPNRDRGGRGGDRHSQSQQQQNEPPVEALKVGQNAWVPDVKKTGKGVDADADKAAADALEVQTVKKAKGLLNKLTIEKFDTISDQFLALPINTQSLLKKVIELVFDKALDEHHFQNMYGRLCQKLSNELPKVQKWIDMDAKNNIFRRLLLNKCQEEFERSEKWSQTDADDALSRKERLQRLHEMSADEKAQYAEDEFQRNKLKRRVLGNISFIGELFKLQMITEKIMHNCVQQLLSKVVDPEEEETECLCKLLKSVGERLDHPAAKSHMDLYFTRIKELSVNQKLPARIRFMIQDLIEQRRSKWKARIEVVGPMKISEIQEREDKKQREEEEAIRQRNASGGGGGRGGRGGRAGQAFGRQNSTSDRSGKSQDVRSQADGGWNTVAEKARSTRQVDDNLNNFGKLELKKPSSGLHFGPPSSTWNRGAQGGAARDEAEKPRAAATGGNMFSVLSAAENVSERKKSIDIVRSTTPTNSDSTPKAKVVEAPAAPEKLSKSQANKKIEATCKEWFSIFDIAEFAAAQKEFGTDEYNGELVSAVLNSSIEKKMDEVRKLADLLHHLVKEGNVSEADVLKSFGDVLEMIDDISIDIPAVFKFMGVLYGRLLTLESSSFTLSNFFEALEPMFKAEERKKIADGPKLVAEAFLTIASCESEDFLQKMVKENPFDLKQIFPIASRTDEAVAIWMESNKLFFLNPLLKVTWGLRVKLGDSEAALAFLKQDEVAALEKNDQLGFVRVVALSVLKHLGQNTIFAQGSKKPLEITREQFVKLEEILTAHVALFNTFIQNSLEKKVEVLFACQEFWDEGDRFKTFLEHLFRIFLKVKIVDEEAVNAWKADKIRLESSKKAALEELSNWFKSIRKG